MVIFAVTLVRHGETGHNKDNVIQGQLDVPLSSVGVQQAQLLGLHLQHQKYTHVYSSDLSRARKTAEHILEKSQACQVDITEDQRLRERKFGVVEGKNVKYLKEAAGQTNQPLVHYTPVGAETVQQVQQRAILFFQDLCQWMRELARKGPDLDHDSTYQSPVHNRHHCASADNLHRSKRKREDSCDEGLDCLSSRPVAPSSPVLDTTSQNAKSSNSECACSAQNAPSASVAPTFTDDAIRSHLQPCKCDCQDSDCPNVSLSPLVTHNANSMHDIKQTNHSDQRERRSSICSSNDENDSSPDLVGNILVVSHGGLLKELVRYFVEELGCSLPGGKKQAMRISPNAGLSKFTISLTENEEDRAKVICHQIHDKHHLGDLGFQILERPPENIAL